MIQNPGTKILGTPLIFPEVVRLYYPRHYIIWTVRIGTRYDENDIGSNMLTRGITSVFRFRFRFQKPRLRRHVGKLQSYREIRIIVLPVIV